MTTSSIEWTDKTWNPVRGCSIVSPGCVHCYAMKQAHRFSGPGRAYEGLTKLTAAGPQWTGRVACDESKLLEPLSWRKPCLVFVNSMSDLFHEDVPDAFIDQVFAVMALAPQHTFQILTKRAARMRQYFAVDEVDLRKRWGNAARTSPFTADLIWIWNEEAIETFSEFVPAAPAPVPLPNVWLGVSCEDQQRADERIPLLLQTPAAVRFISAEPLLGPLNLREMAAVDDWHVDALDTPDPSRRLRWVIVGGESGPGARPCDLAWVRSIVQQCRAAGVACFVKQLGAWIKWPPVGVDQGFIDRTRLDPIFLKHAPPVAFGLCDRKGGDISEFPPDLRVREYPEVRA
jgi:protein gp37